mmetsp:Transcript_17089/g.19109  ORF Transcript_17089/g.19109 Transcript_17089/m.19109 type:complete len:155 (-) Transcript_17089:39-503(-)
MLGSRAARVLRQGRPGLRQGSQVTKRGFSARTDEAFEKKLIKDFNSQTTDLKGNLRHWSKEFDADQWSMTRFAATGVLAFTAVAYGSLWIRQNDTITHGMATSQEVGQPIFTAHYLNDESKPVAHVVDPSVRAERTLAKTPVTSADQHITFRRH